jgi:DNA repair exonuclease
MEKKIAVVALLVFLFNTQIVFGKAVSPMENQLHVNLNGTFKIMVIADIQDSVNTNKHTLQLMSAALESERPDLVILNGDNIFGMTPKLLFSKENTLKAIDSLLAPIVERNIPFCVVMGNHDAEGSLSTHEQMEHYMSYPQCLSEVGDVSVSVGNYHRVIHNRLGQPLFNLWFFDSGNLAPKEEGGGYAYVSDEQIQWYEETSKALRKENKGYPLPSLLFQHIPVPEIYELLIEVPKGTQGAIRGNQGWSSKYFIANPELVFEGTFDEGPCPPDINNGQFESWVQQEDIMAAVFGHDHRNDFIGTYQGIDLVYTPAVGFYSYGGGDRHGVRIIELNETEPDTYTTRMVYYDDLIDEPIPLPLQYLGQLAFLTILGSIFSVLLLVVVGVNVHCRRKRKNK